MKHQAKKTLFFIFFFNMILNAQNKTSNVLWNKIDDEPIQYATIKSDEDYSISNENGVFEVNETSSKIIIQNIAYQKMEVDYGFLKQNDTIYMLPNIYELDEVTIVNDSKFNAMLKTILTDYALVPHQEEFFLRAVIRKNNELYKIVDFSGLLEKKALFSTRSKPMPKENYLVQVENIRKVGIENKKIDFEMLSFEYFLNHISSVYLSPKIYNLTYEVSNNRNYSKIILTPKDSKNTFTKGYYVLNNDNTFSEVEIEYYNENAKFDEIKGVKFRTTFIYTKSNFERNIKTNKIQLNKALVASKTEVYAENGFKDIFDVSYVFYAEPINHVTLKNNINLKKDMFELKGKYDSKYWESNDILPLTQEMQSFINKVNSSGKNSDFKTKTNID